MPLLGLVVEEVGALRISVWVSEDVRLPVWRAGRGPAPAVMAALLENTALTVAAQRHCEDMAARGYFDHFTPEGRSPFDRMREAGFQGSAMGENLAFGHHTAEGVVRAWMGSIGHRANILSPSYTVIGVGRFVARTAQCFGRL